MFTKREKVGEVYREVIDWDQVIGAIGIVAIIIVVLVNLG